MNAALECARARSAAQFLTVLSFNDPGWEEDRLARATGWFPAVGLVVGAVAAAVWLLAAAVLPAPAAAGLALAAGLMLTGGLHEDGLADTADGIGGGGTTARRLEIMADSRIGAHGALALILSLGLRWVALATLAPWAGALALVVAATLGRAAMVPVAAALPYARPKGLGRLAEGAGGREVALALGLALTVALAGGWGGLLALVAAALSAGALAAFLARRLGGYTGDTLGAVEQTAETAALLALAAAWGGP
ncbi:MAG TPA: adenosylcobinamide-GDP ribazoletransferase [Thermohalobaculum sp.]|nr:adenosylcobinamide-GDP ribazoletransferase [Thermohalobaculum sp.]